MTGKGHVYSYMRTRIAQQQELEAPFLCEMSNLHYQHDDFERARTQ